MKQSDLKKIIKPLIKECLAEMFISMNFEQVISESISAALNSKSNIVQEQRPRQQMKDPNLEAKRLANRRKMLDEMHSDSTRPVVTPKSEPKNILESVLQDTEDSGYEIGDGNTNPELVSEDTVDELLGGQDFSKYL